MKKFFAVVLSLSLFVSIPILPVQAASTPDTRKEAFALEKQNWMNLSNEQMLTDFDYLYETMKENYPYFGVAKRKKGIDIDALYNYTRPLIADCKTDMEFWYTMKDFVNAVDYTGHFGILDSIGYQSYVDMWNELAEEDPRTLEDRGAWIEQLNNPVSTKNYAAMQELFQPIFHKQKAVSASNHKNRSSSNVTTKILEKGKTAYINIRSFGYENIEKDKQKLFDFYKKVADYDNLIIDITENGGGSMSYYFNLIVAPNIDKPLATKNYVLYMDGENNRNYVNFEEEAKEGYLLPTKEFPDLEKMNKDDLQTLDYFNESGFTLNPLKEGEKMFKGKLWVLTSPKVYSSSESFAAYCKDTGFAALVGNQTGGDGIGMDPIYIALPNSGIICQHSMIYGVTADGANSEEFGTTPDYISAENETPLETCLKVIKEEL